MWWGEKYLISVDDQGREEGPAGAGPLKRSASVGLIRAKIALIYLGELGPVWGLSLLEYQVINPLQGKTITTGSLECGTVMALPKKLPGEITQNIIQSPNKKGKG